jgi:hypothetical protein
MAAISQYSEAGVTFYNPNGPNNLITSGEGVSGYPDDGTAYLLCPPGASLAFAFTSPTYFGLATLDLAAYSAGQAGPFSLNVVGYGQMGLMVTNVFTVDTLADRRANHLPDFQTFTLDSTFQHIFRVDILGTTFALDNVALTGVPEPSTTAVALFASAIMLIRPRAPVRKGSPTLKHRDRNLQKMFTTDPLRSWS